MKSKLSTIKEAKKSSRQERKKIRMSQSAPEPEKKNPKYYGYGKLQLPMEVLQELKIIKLAYELAWADKVDWDSMTDEELENFSLPRVTYGDLMVRLMTGIKRNDPEVVEHIEEARAVAGEREKWRLRRKALRKYADDNKESLDKVIKEESKGKMVLQDDEDPDNETQFETPPAEKALLYPVDPTEGDIWEMEYFFTDENGEKYDAFPEEHKSEDPNEESRYDFWTIWNHMNMSYQEMIDFGYRLMNDAGVEITPEDMPKVCKILVEHRKHQK